MDKNTTNTRWTTAANDPILETPIATKKRGAWRNRLLWWGALIGVGYVLIFRPVNAPAIISACVVLLWLANRKK